MECIEIWTQYRTFLLNKKEQSLKERDNILAEQTELRNRWKEGRQRLALPFFGEYGIINKCFPCIFIGFRRADKAHYGIARGIVLTLKQAGGT